MVGSPRVPLSSCNPRDATPPGDWENPNCNTDVGGKWGIHDDGAPAAVLPFMSLSDSEESSSE
jgi:hypothetical protein